MSEERKSGVYDTYNHSYYGLQVCASEINNIIENIDNKLDDFGYLHEE